MSVKNTYGISFIVYGLTEEEKEELNIYTPCEIILYSLILSFTRGRYGIYFGTREYLANLLNISTRTISRYLKMLTEKGLIEKTAASGEIRSGYRAIKFPKKLEEEIKNEEEIAEEDAPLARKAPNAKKRASEDCEACGEDEDELDDDLEWHRQFADFDVKPKKRPKPHTPKYEYATFGKTQEIYMTWDQYFALTKLVDDTEVSSYIARLEKFLETIPKGCSPHSHYRTLRKWILQDHKA